MSMPPPPPKLMRLPPDVKEASLEELLYGEAKYLPHRQAPELLLLSRAIRDYFLEIDIYGVYAYLSLKKLAAFTPDKFGSDVDIEAGLRSLTVEELRAASVYSGKGHQLRPSSHLSEVACAWIEMHLFHVHPDKQEIASRIKAFSRFLISGDTLVLLSTPFNYNEDLAYCMEKSIIIHRGRSEWPVLVNDDQGINALQLDDDDLDKVEAGTSNLLLKCAKDGNAKIIKGEDIVSLMKTIIARPLLIDTRVVTEAPPE